jgi:hypothetical protein
MRFLQRGQHHIPALKDCGAGALRLPPCVVFALGFAVGIMPPFVRANLQAQYLPNLKVRHQVQHLQPQP